MGHNSNVSHYVYVCFFFLAFSLYLSSRWFLSHISLVTISIVWLFYGIAPTVAGVLYTTVSLYSLIGGPKAWICQQTTRCLCVWVFVYFTLLFLIFCFFFILFLHTMKNEHIRNFKAMHTLKYGTKYSTKFSTWLYYHELCN